MNIKWVWLSLIISVNGGLQASYLEKLKRETPSAQILGIQHSANAAQTSAAFLPVWPFAPRCAFFSKKPPQIKTGLYEALQKNYNSLLMLEEIELMKQFFEILKISTNEWNSVANNYFSLFKELERKTAQKCSDTVDSIIKEKIRSLMFGYGIDIVPIKIMRSQNDVEFCSIAHCLIMINQSAMNSLTPVQFEVFIGHEIMHKLYDDPYTTFCMKLLISKIQDSADKIKAQLFLKKWYQFSERRADIMAALKSPAHAKALIECCEKALKQGIIKDDYNPTIAFRLAYLTQLYKEMIELTPPTAATQE